jgi:hypothetical protein
VRQALSGLAPRLKGVPACWCGGQGRDWDICPKPDNCNWDPCMGDMLDCVSPRFGTSIDSRLAVELASLRGRVYETSDNQGWSYMFSIVDPIPTARLDRKCKVPKKDGKLDIMNAFIVKFRKNATRQDTEGRASCVVIASSSSQIFARAFNKRSIYTKHWGKNTCGGGSGDRGGHGPGNPSCSAEDNTTTVQIRLLDTESVPCECSNGFNGICLGRCYSNTNCTFPCSCHDPCCTLKKSCLQQHAHNNFTLIIQPWASRKTRAPGQTPAATVGQVKLDCSDVKTSCNYILTWPALGWNCTQQ